MTTATGSRGPAQQTEVRSKPAWQADVTWVKRHYTTEEEAPAGEIEETPDGGTVLTPKRRTVTVDHSVWVCIVRVSRPGRERIDFRVNHREGRDVTFTDPRGRNMGAAGVTGIWGTLPAPLVDKPRPLSAHAFRVELARLAGAERAEEIIRTILSPGFFLS